MSYRLLVYDTRALITIPRDPVRRNFEKIVYDGPSLCQKTTSGLTTNLINFEYPEVSIGPTPFVQCHVDKLNLCIRYQLSGRLPTVKDHVPSKGTHGSLSEILVEGRWEIYSPKDSEGGRVPPNSFLLRIRVSPRMYMDLLGLLRTDGGSSM